MIDLNVRHPNISGITATNVMEQYMNAFENTGDSQKSSEAMFARKVILVEGESEVLILPYLFELLDYDPVLEGVTIVRCGGKNEIDRFYRLYSEFGIPCYVIFDGDYNNVGKDSEKEKKTIEDNRVILGLFGVNGDFPDNIVTATAIAKECGILGPEVDLNHLGPNEIEQDPEAMNDNKRKQDYINELLKTKPRAITGNSFYTCVGGLICEVCQKDTNLCKCPKTAAEAKEWAAKRNEEPKPVKKDVIRNMDNFKIITNNLNVGRF